MQRSMSRSRGLPHRNRRRTLLAGLLAVVAGLLAVVAAAVPFGSRPRSAATPALAAAPRAQTDPPVPTTVPAPVSATTTSVPVSATTTSVPVSTTTTSVPVSTTTSAPVSTTTTSAPVSATAASAVPVPTVAPIATLPAGVHTLLVIGSDARPKEDPRRTRADSLHLLVANTITGDAAIVGFPRDSYVQIPGRGRTKINASLQYGGPALTVATITKLTGIPIENYVLTGFKGFRSLIDTIGAVEVFVDRKMNDRFSGARFKVGKLLMGGRSALAYNRNRYDTPNGDFSRSENQGKFILASLKKLRSQAGDDATVRRWTDLLMRFVVTDASPQKLAQFAVTARGIDPARVRNVVVPGRAGMAGRASVVYLAASASALFADLRADGVLNRR